MAVFFPGEAAYRPPWFSTCTCSRIESLETAAFLWVGRPSPSPNQKCQSTEGKAQCRNTCECKVILNVSTVYRHNCCCLQIWKTYTYTAIFTCSSKVARLKRIELDVSHWRVITVDVTYRPWTHVLDDTRVCAFFSRMKKTKQLECGSMPNVMVALPNIGGALCSTPQSLADAHHVTAV